MSEQQNNLPRKPELFITEGVEFSISGLSLHISKGKLETSPVTLNTFFDISPHWLAIAYDHLLNTERAYSDLMIAKETKNYDNLGNALRAEFSSCVQAMMACAISLDAYYACVKDRIKIPEDLNRSWQENNLGRYKQIAETLRIAFPMKNELFKQVRNALKEIYRFRDMAVHPPAKSAKPLVRPELNLIIDWRYIAFNYNSAKQISNLSFSIISKTAIMSPNPKFTALEPYCKTLMSRMSPIIQRWNSHYGPLD